MTAQVMPALSKVCVMIDMGFSASFWTELLWKALRSCCSDWLAELELELAPSWTWNRIPS